MVHAENAGSKVTGAAPGERCGLLQNQTESESGSDSLTGRNAESGSDQRNALISNTKYREIGWFGRLKGVI